MALILHIIIALSSIGFTTFVFFSPSKPKLNISYGLVITTLLSGFYLVASTHARLLQACISGLVYLGFMTFMLVTARYKLANIDDK